MTKTDIASEVKSSEVRSYPSLGDKFGHTLHLTWLATAGEISIQSMAQQLGITERTARNYVKNYRRSGDSTVLLDRRRFNSGQKRAYAIEPYRGRLLEHWIMLALEGQSVSSRQLEGLLEQAVSNRTIDRFLTQSGLRQAQESGITQRIRDYFLQERKQAYWAGIASQPLADLDLDQDQEVDPHPHPNTSAYIRPGAQIDPNKPVIDPISTTTLEASSSPDTFYSDTNWPSASVTSLLWAKISVQNSQIKLLGLAELLNLPQALINLLLAGVDMQLLLQQVSLINKTALLLLPTVQQATVVEWPAALDLLPSVQQATVPLLPAALDLPPPSVQQATVPLLPAVLGLVPRVQKATVPLLPAAPLLASRVQQGTVPLLAATLDLVPMPKATMPLLAPVTDPAVDMQQAIVLLSPTITDLVLIRQAICPNKTIVDLTPFVQELPVKVVTQTGGASPNSSMPQPASLMRPLQQPVALEKKRGQPASLPTPSKTNIDSDNNNNNNSNSSIKNSRNIKNSSSSISSINSNNSSSNSLPAADEWEEAKVGQVGIGLGLAHLYSNGAFKSLEKLLPEERSGYLPSWLLTTGLMLYLLASGGQRLSVAKHFVWSKISGLLASSRGLSASTLRNWLITLERRAKESVVVQRSNGKSETISRLRDYQEESVAQRHQAGLIYGRKAYLDDYVNALFRSEPIARAKHGTSAHIVKAFRRHVCQDIETSLPITCPLGPSNSTSSQVLEKTVSLVNAGLDRVKSESLKMVVADRWWSNEPAIRSAQKLSVGLLTWTKNDPSIKKAMNEISDTEWFNLSANQEANRESPKISKQQADKDGPKEPETTYYLDTEIMIYKLQQPVRTVAHWNGKAEGKKLAALAIGLESDKYKESELLNYLPFRQRVEILIKGLQRRVQLANFGGGKAIIRQEERNDPLESDQKRWQKNQKQVQTRQKKAKVRLCEVEKEIKHLESHRKAKPRNSLALGKNELKQLARSLGNKISRYSKRLVELSGLLAWAHGEAEEPAKAEVAELDLTREELLTQMKLDIFTAQETLVNEFIDIGLKPVLLREAKEQAHRRKEEAKRSVAQKSQGKLLTTDIEELYKKKVENLERETILHRLTNQPGEFLLHSDKRLILSVFQRFRDKRTQTAFEHYCPFLNQKDIQIRLDDGPPWRLLFTYHTESVG